MFADRSLREFGGAWLHPDPMSYYATRRIQGIPMKHKTDVVTTPDRYESFAGTSLAEGPS